MARGEPAWRAHRNHFYQRAVQHGMRHADVARQVTSANLVLIALAYLSTQASPWLALALAVLPVATLLRRFGRASPLPSAG